MQFRTRSDEKRMIVEVQESRLDAAIAVQFKDAVRDIASRGPATIILDLGAVRFLDSSGLGSVVGAMKMLAPERRLELARLTEPVSKVFRLTRMDTVFAIHDEVPHLSTAQSDSANAC